MKIQWETKLSEYQANNTQAVTREKEESIKASHSSGLIVQLYIYKIYRAFKMKWSFFPGEHVSRATVRWFTHGI